MLIHSCVLILTRTRTTPYYMLSPLPSTLTFSSSLTLALCVSCASFSLSFFAAQVSSANFCASSRESVTKISSKIVPAFTFTHNVTCHHWFERSVMFNVPTLLRQRRVNRGSRLWRSDHVARGPSLAMTPTLITSKYMFFKQYRHI